jgi:5'-nucleotidase
VLILLSNDDGVHSAGLTALRDVFRDKHTVYVIAPDRERTCVAHAITIHKPLRVNDLGDNVFSTSGTPADCVYIGVRTLLPRPPDLIISGINSGANMGQDVNYSGTVAAAKEGALLGIPSVSVSMNGRSNFFFTEGAKIIEEIADLIMRRPPPEGTFLNINIPNIPHGQISGFMVTRLGKRIYNDKVTVRIDPRGSRYYWIGGDGENYEPIDGTDFLAIEKGCVSITPLGLDTTSESSIEIYRTYFRRHG